MEDAENKPLAVLEFLDAEGASCGIMELYGVENTVAVLGEEDRDLAFSEGGHVGSVAVSLERVQLLEGRRYDYILSGLSNGYELDTDSSPCLQAHRADPSRGHLEPGTFTGLIPLQLRGPNGEEATARVEVQSAKAGSLRHYVTMVEDIAERCTELLMQITSPSRARFESFGEEDAQTLTQRFFFLEALLGRRSFQTAVERIVRNPHIRSTGVDVEKDLACGGFPIRANELRQIASGRPRRKLPKDHPLYESVPGFTSVPERVTTREHVDFMDTAENRFVKHALRTFLFTLEEIAEALRRDRGNGAKEHVAQRADALAVRLQEHLAHGFFHSLSPPTVMPLGSPVLQQREGYREVLQAWLHFELAAQLVWQGGEEVFGAGKRDIAKLYEFWLYFKLEDAVADVFDMAGRPSDENGGGLIRETDDGLGLTLESGKRLDWQGGYRVDERQEKQLNVRFSFNRIFAGAGSPSNTVEDDGNVHSFPRKAGGAWTAYMRPDYTISLWPAEMTEEAAERDERIVHLHFDAKYRVQNVADAQGKPVQILALFSEESSATATAVDGTQIAESAGLGSEGEEAVEEQEEAEEHGRASKRTDLLKMHAYRDAIRRSEGAYVLYPGDREKRWAEYHELLPGIGAFPVCPGAPDDMRNVEDFLRRSADLCADRFSQLRRRKYWEFETVREAPKAYDADPGARPVPEDPALPPADALVTVGFVRKEALDACACNGIFYFHARYQTKGEARRYDPLVFGAKYFVPQSDYGPVGWYGKVTGVGMVHVYELESKVGAHALGPPRSNPWKRPTHYYCLYLDVTDDRVPVQPGRWKSFLRAKNREHRGAPFTTSWAELWGVDEARGRE